MLFSKDTARKSFRGIIVADGNRRLENYGTMVDVSVDKVHGAASNLDSVIESLLLRLQTGKRRKECGVYVYDSSSIEIDELLAEDPEIACQYNEPGFRGHPARLESGNSLLVVAPVFLRDTFVVQSDCGELGRLLITILTSHLVR